MPRWHEDDVDRACNAWAYQWVLAYANDLGGQVGAPHCTLANLHRLHDGAGSRTDRAHQACPEVFLGDGLLVAIALKAMGELSRELIHRHYVERWFEWRADKSKWMRRVRPVKQRVIAERMGFSVAQYHHLRDMAKRCVGVVLYLDSEELARARGTEVDSSSVA